MRPTLPLYAALSSALVLAACGDSGSESGSGEVVSGTGYEYALPEGWRDNSDELKTADSAARNDSSAASVSVSVLPVVAEQTLKQVARGQVSQVRRGVKDPPRPDWRIEPPGPLRSTELDGEQAMQFEHGLVIEGARQTARQLTVLHDGTVYTIQFLSRGSRVSSDRTQVDEIVDSWRWRAKAGR